jgi:hypothetical protein
MSKLDSERTNLTSRPGDSECRPAGLSPGWTRIGSTRAQFRHKLVRGRRHPEESAKVELVRHDKDPDPVGRGERHVAEEALNAAALLQDERTRPTRHHGDPGEAKPIHPARLVKAQHRREAVARDIDRMIDALTARLSSDPDAFPG